MPTIGVEAVVAGGCRLSEAAAAAEPWVCPDCFWCSLVATWGAVSLGCSGSSRAFLTRLSISTLFACSTSRWVRNLWIRTAVAAGPLRICRKYVAHSASVFGISNFEKSSSTIELASSAKRHGWGPEETPGRGARGGAFLASINCDQVLRKSGLRTKKRWGHWLPIG